MTTKHENNKRLATAGLVEFPFAGKTRFAESRNQKHRIRNKPENGSEKRGGVGCKSLEGRHAIARG